MMMAVLNISVFVVRYLLCQFCWHKTNLWTNNGYSDNQHDDCNSSIIAAVVVPNSGTIVAPVMVTDFV